MHDVVVADLANAYEIFHNAELPNGDHPYKTVVCGQTSIIRSAGFSLQLAWSLDELTNADTIIVPGTTNLDSQISKEITHELSAAQSRGARVASICTGAFILAQCGLLNGKDVTTHWKVTDLLAKLYPEIKVLPNVIYTDNGNIFTSAGATAGIDLCLHLIKKDWGSSVAANTAKLAVVPLERTGNQAQFIIRQKAPNNTNLANLLQWLEHSLEQDITLSQMAEKASISVRTLNRRFSEQLQTSPNKWLIQARVRAAQSLLETTDLQIEQIADKVGFNSSALLREHFASQLGMSPKHYRKSFKTDSMN